MPFLSVGEFRTVLQQYKFGSHKICCAIQILPEKVSYYEKEPENDFNWMTAARWTKLESCLWRMLNSLADWQRDAPKLKTEMIVDHIQVTIRATEEFLAASQQLLNLRKGAFGNDDLALNIVLKYMSHEDSTVISTQATKRKHDVAAKSSQSENVSKATTKSSGSKRSKLQEQPSTSNYSSKSSTRSRKRERRSVSQQNTGLSTQKEHTARDSRSQTPGSLQQQKAGSTAVEPRPERRSARSPKQPVNYNELHLGTKTKENAKSSKREPSVKIKPTSAASNGEKKQVNKRVDPWSLEQLDGDPKQTEVFKKINDMLKVPKPREVKILLLKDMDEATVLSTFDKYSKHFDQLFNQRRHKFQTLSYMTIDHCHVMDILSKTIRGKMIKKLGEVYSKSGAHGTLILNGLLPMWIIHLFMDKYNFKLEEAVRQIADQLKYHTYLKAVNNESLGDLDE